MSSFNAGSIEADLTLGRSRWVRDLRTTKKEIAELERRSITIEIDADDTNARVVLDNIEMLADDLDNSTYTFSVDANTAEAAAKMEVLETKVDRLDGREVGISADADIINAMIQLDILENQMDVLESDPINIEADADVADVVATLSALEEQVESLDGRQIDITGDADVADDMARIAALAAEVEALDGREIDIDVDFDRDNLESLVGSAGGAGGGGGGGGYLGLLRILIYAIILLSPVLAVAISSVTAAIVAFTAALTAAAGAALVLAGGLVGLVQRFKETDPSDYTPAMQAFADSIEAVSDAWGVFLDGIEGPGFNLMAQALNLVADILPDLVPLFNAVADAMSGVLDGLASWIDSPQYQEMLDFFGGFGVDMLVSFLEIGGNLLVFFGELFAAIEPFAREMMTGLEDLTAGWAEWAEGLEDNRAFQDFMENAAEYGPMVLDMLGSLLAAFMNLGEALKPFAGPMLEGLTWFFDLIANADPGVLTDLIGLFAGLWAGAKILPPVLGPIVTLIGALSLPALLAAAGIAALAFAVKELWEESEIFRDAVNGAWESIQDTVTPIVEDIVTTIEEHWGPITEWATELWEEFKGIVEDAMVSIEVIITEVLDEIQFAWDNWGDETLAVVVWLFGILGETITAGFDMIAGIFQFVRGALTGDWDMMWDGIKKAFSGGLEALAALTRIATDPIVKAWNGFTSRLKKSWEEFIADVKTIWNGVREWLGTKFDNFKNWVAGWTVRAVDLFLDIRERWTAVRGWIDEKWAAFKTWVSGWAIKAANIWDDIKTKWTSMKEDIETKWTNFKAAIAGWSVNAAGIFDGIKNAFAAALNAIIRVWNDFELSIDIPDKIPGLPSKMTISTPNFSPVALAEGAYLTRATLAVVGEAGPEIVAPEPVLRQIVQEHSGGASEIDTAALASAISSALGPLFRMLGVSIDQLRQIIEESGMGIKIEARADTVDGQSTIDALTQAIMFNLRLAGFGGANT